MEIFNTDIQYMNRTYAKILFLPQDSEFFESHMNTTCNSERLPGLMEGEVYEVHPTDLQELAERPWFGHHGSYPGDYGAHAVFCTGGQIHAHPSDADGNLSLYATDIFRPAASMEIPMHTLQFVVALRGLVGRLMDESEKFIMQQLTAIEAAEKNVDSGDASS